MLKDQNPCELQYMMLVYFKPGETKAGQQVKRSFSFMPKHFIDTSRNDVGVIGGSFVMDASDDVANDDEFKKIIDNARTFYGLNQ